MGNAPHGPYLDCMDESARLESERQFHDAQAARRRPDLRSDDLRFDDDAYLDHETWIRPAFAKLGDPRGRRILDLGCGHGMAAIVLARQGAIVTGLELSSGYLDEARRRAEVNGVAIDWIQANAEHLPFPDASFDRVWGNAILHHLDLGHAADELRRVLRPGGIAIFCEPWGDNPLLRYARRRLDYPGKQHTPDESPLRSDCLPILRSRFPELRFTGHQLLGMMRRYWGERGINVMLDRVDEAILRVVPPLGRWCRYMVIELAW